MKREIIGDRRTFLKTAAIFGGATLSLWLGRKQATAAPAQTSPPVTESNSGRYRLTDHVKRYYETANL